MRVATWFAALFVALAHSSLCIAMEGGSGPEGHLYLVGRDGIMLRRQNVTLANVHDELRRRGVGKDRLVIHIAEDASPQLVRQVYRHFHRLGYVSIETRILGAWFIERLYSK